jgi:hypothetical protein
MWSSGETWQTNTGWKASKLRVWQGSSARACQDMSQLTPWSLSTDVFARTSKYGTVSFTSSPLSDIDVDPHLIVVEAPLWFWKLKRDRGSCDIRHLRLTKARDGPLSAPGAFSPLGPCNSLEADARDLITSLRQMTSQLPTLRSFPSLLHSMHSGLMRAHRPPS